MFIMPKKDESNSKKKAVFFPSDQEIAEQYGFPNLFKSADREQVSNGKTVTICDWVTAHDDKIPNADATDDVEEKKIGQWLNAKKRAKRGEGNWVFYHSDQKIAESRGYPDLFDSMGEEAANNKMTLKLCAWVKDHGGKEPYTGSQDKEEAKLGKWLANRRKSPEQLAILIKTDSGVPAEDYRTTGNYLHDYQTKISMISKSDLNKIRPLMECIHEFDPYLADWESKEDGETIWTEDEYDSNYPLGKCYSPERGELSPREIYEIPNHNDRCVTDKSVFDLFETFLPSHDKGIHTVVSITIFSIEEKERIK